MFYDEMLPIALQCGMTAEEFWYGEPRLFCSYIKKRDAELDEMNYQAWLFGLYVYKAVGVVLGNAFSNKSSIKDTYFEKPLEQLNSNYVELKEEEKEKITDNNHRTQVNYWAKLGRKEYVKENG